MNRDVRKELSADELLKKIQALAFAKVETELYLNSHPECASALEYYKELCEEYDSLVSLYENTVAPLTHEGAARGTWKWIDSPWPWQNDKEA